MRTQKASKQKNNNVKKRNWAFVVYPESAPTDWVEQLQKTGLQCAVSPLHDKDINPTGEPKKAHYHVIATYSGPTSYNVVQALTTSLNAPRPEALEQIRGYYRYLTHKDNPEKYQYDEKDITSVNGFNIADFVELSKSEVNEIKRKLQTLIRQENILEYADLLDILLDSEMLLEHEIASNHTLYFGTYITSRRHKAEKSKQSKPSRVIKVNQDTGELIDEND